MSFIIKDTHSVFFYNITLIQSWYTLSYYGTQTLLVLYLIHNFHFSAEQSYLLYGGFVALLFTLPTLGAFIADRFVGLLPAFLSGSFLGIVANFLLSIQSNFAFAAGLAFLIVGAGLTKSSSLSLTGFIYQHDLAKKEKAYRFLYVASNIGAVLGPLLYGISAYSWGWNKGFLISAIGLFIATLIFLVFIQKATIAAIPKPKTRNHLIYLILLPVILIIILLFYFPQILNPLISTFLILSLLYFAMIIFKESGVVRKYLLILLITSFFAMFYYLAAMQVGSTIMVFIQNKISLGQIHFHFPATLFASLYTVLIILFSPIVNWVLEILRNKRVNITFLHKISLGIACGGLGLISFALATMSTSPLALIIIGIALLSLGELILAPAIYTMISKHSPQHLKTTMMGCWLLFVALGGYLSSSYVRFFLHFKLQSDFLLFMSMGLIILLSAMTLILISSKLKAN